MPQKRRPHRVGLMVQLSAGTEYDAVEGVLDYVHEQQHHWQFDSNGHVPFLRFDELDLGGIDGLIGIFFEREWADAVIEAGIAAVDTGAALEDQRLVRVTNDDQLIGRVGAHHLMETGLGEFGFVMAADPISSQRRFDGFREAVEESGRTCHVLTIPAAQREAWLELISKWLVQVPKPIGVMADDDNLGVDLVNTAAGSGLRVPDDVAVLGVNNDRWTPGITAVPMSSIAVDMRRVGYRAAQVLDELMAGEVPASVRPIPPVGVVTRQSTDVTLTQDQLVQKAMRFIRNHVADGISVEDVLAAVGVSAPTLTKRMKAAIGQTPHQAICQARVDRAKQLMDQTDKSLDVISRQCGFARQSRLSEVFKRITGMTPGQYRQRQQRTARAVSR